MSKRTWRPVFVMGLLLWSSACARQMTSNPVTPAPGSGPSITTDTGRMAPGHREFSRYDTPGKCRDAVLTARDALWRTEERDTLPYAPEHDTLPTAAVQIGRECGNRFTVQETEPRELRNLVVLLLMLNQDDVARTAIDRRLGLAQTVSEQGQVLYETLQAYMTAQPMRKDAAESIVRQMDAMARPILGLRAAAHAVMQEDALQRFDRPRLRQEAQTIIADGQEMNATERDDWMPVIRSAYLALTSLAWFEHPSDIPHLYAQAQTDLGALRNGTGALGFFGYPLFQMNMVTTQVLAMLGEPTPQLQAQYWFGAGRDTVRPQQGKVSLLVHVDKDCGQSCYPMYATLRRLYAKYASQGLEITLMTKTTGYSPGSAPQTPLVEATSAKEYFLAFLKLPFALGVARTPFSHRPDGRRVDGKVQFERAYVGANMVLSDRDGKTVMLSGERNEAPLEAYVRRALGLAD